MNDTTSPSTQPTAAPETTAPADDPLTGLNTALAAEHAAVYAYGIAGARLTGSRRDRAAEAFNAHRARRDRLRTLVTERGGMPAEPEPAYELPFPVVTGADCARLAALVEERVTAAYLELTAVREPALRRMAALAMQECAVRGYGWQPVAAALPGYPSQVLSAAPAPSPAGGSPSGGQ